MSRLPSNRITRWGPIAFYCALIFAVSSVSRFSPQLNKLWNYDKLIHFTEYAVLGFLVARSMSLSATRRLSSPFWFCVAVLFVVGYGFSDEWHQRFVNGRSFDLYDWLADAVGGTTAIVGYRLIGHRDDSSFPKA